MPFKTIVLATHNSHKLSEFRALFSPLSIKVQSLNELDIPAIDEPYDTFVENALHKARQVSITTGLPALADDSGLCVCALGGAPGVHSARFAGQPTSDTANNALLINKLKGIENRQAYYVCSLVLFRPQHPAFPIITDGIWTGTIADTPCGIYGFGYDPIFYLSEYQCTVAELAPDIKNRFSHRAQALTSLLHKINTAGISV